MIAAVFLAMPYAYRQGANIRVTFLVDRLRGPARLVVDHVVQLVSLLYCAALVVATFMQARHIFRTGTTFTTIEAPLWPGHLVVAIALFLTALMLLVDLGEVRKRSVEPLPGRLSARGLHPVRRDAGVAAARRAHRVLAGGRRHRGHLPARRRLERRAADPRNDAVRGRRRLRADDDPDVHPHGVFLGVGRSRARSLHGGRELALQRARRARHRHGVRVRDLRRHVGREPRRGGGDGEHRDAGDAPPRLLGSARRGRDRHRRHARHPDSAERGHGHLRHQHADLDRQAAHRRRGAGHHRGRVPDHRHHHLGARAARRTRRRSMSCRRASAGRACCASGRAWC